MKNRISVIFCVIFLGLFSVYGQDSRMMAASRNTAVRCLKLAENCLLGGDWNNALSQAELGLSYDDSISDLYYIKAAAFSNMGKSRSEVIETICLAFMYNDWVNYNKNGARILLADLLSDTGEYDMSNEFLNQEPFIYSSDAEFIRIKNLYRKGTASDIETARLKVNSSRRIYPDDERFPTIFFMFESLFMQKALQNNQDYIVPEIVQTIADSYIVKIPDYDKDNVELEFLAAEFASGEKKQRLLRAIEARNINSDFYAYSGLKAGILSEETALQLFMDTTSEQITLNLLLSFVPLIKNDETRALLFDYLNSYEGNLLIDENNDLQNEITVDYTRGRPEYIYYDRNNDGINEIYSVCDFGVPLSVYYGKTDAELFYDIYPAVKKVSFYKSQFAYNFLHDDFVYNSFSLVVPETLKSLNLEFFIPVFDKDISVPSETLLASKSSSVGLPVDERNNSRVVYTTQNNVPVFAEFYNDNTKYAECSFQGGMPFVRYVDYNNDGFYETIETYDLQTDGVSIDKDFIHKTFGSISDGWNLRVMKIEIDSNRDTIVEYCEKYDLDGKVTSSWDTDADGKWNSQYVKYAADKNGNVSEEYVFYDVNGYDEVRVLSINQVPSELYCDGKNQIIYKGTEDSVYWLEEKGVIDYETEILKKCREMEQGAVTLVEFNDERISVIRIEDKLFCRILPSFDDSILENRDNESVNTKDNSNAL